MKWKKTRITRFYIGLIFFSIFFICSINFFFLLTPNSHENCSCPKCVSQHNNIKYDSIEEITFISSPKPVSSYNYNIMKLSLSSWLSVSPDSRIILFCHPLEFDPSGKLVEELETLFGKARIKYEKPVRHDMDGIPYVDDWFRQGIKKSESKHVCFINNDIVLSSGWLQRTKQAFETFGNQSAVLIGQRIDFDFDNEQFKNLKFDPNTLLGDIDKMVMMLNHSEHSPLDVDTFTFKIDPLPFDYELIPPFIMGIYTWDKWIVGWLNKITNTLTFHLDPPIYHVGQKTLTYDSDDDKVATNNHLKKANNNYFGSNSDTVWEIIDGNIVNCKTQKVFH